jgi:hypothetical protein
LSQVPTLRVDVSRVPPSVRRQALIALDFLGCSIGVRLVLSEPDEAHIQYGGPADVPPRARLWIPFWSETYDASAPHGTRLVDGLPCWLPEAREDEGTPDLIGSTWRLLILADESQVAPGSRAPNGAFLAAALPGPRQATLDEPLAEWHAELLVQRLEAHGIGLVDRVARWPLDRRYAVLVTHDADGPRLQQPTELAKAIAKAVTRRSRPEARAFVAGLSSSIRRRPDPYFGFAGWAEAERAIDARSAFFLYARSEVRRHPRDPVYVIDRHPRWDILRSLADAGWELGTHAGIHAAESVEGLRSERLALEAAIGRPVRGLRHHYWNLDWRSPSTTFERHLEAGYGYDCSIAWRDRPGFRAGTSLPYFPVSTSGDRPLTLLEIPTCLMDGHLFEFEGLDTDAATISAERLRERTARAGGVFNIDWHERTLCDRFSYEGWATVALRLLSSLSSDAWITTPNELAAWWRSRAATVGLSEVRS